MSLGEVGPPAPFGDGAVAGVALYGYGGAPRRGAQTRGGHLHLGARLEEAGDDLPAATPQRHGFSYI